MLISLLNPEQLSREQITYLLFENEKDKDDGSCGDCIFTFGGKGIERVKKAIELYNLGRSKHILFSGGTKYGKYSIPEAIEMRDSAIKSGVPGSDIIVECESNNTKENVISSLVILDRAFGLHNIKRLIVVSIPWGMRRQLLTLRTYFPKWIKYTWCPADYKDHQSNNWWLNPEVSGYVLNEAKTVIKLTQEGQIIDENIEI